MLDVYVPNLLQTTKKKVSYIPNRQQLDLMCRMLETDKQYFLKNIPKVELHAHLLGCFPKEDVWNLTQKYQGDHISRNSFNQIFLFKNFTEFQQAWRFKNSLIKTYDDFSFMMDGVVKYAQKQKIVYWELMIALFELPPLDPAKLLDIAYNKLKTGGIEFSFIMDFPRGDGLKKLQQQYNFYNGMAKRYNIRGVGLSGFEEKHGLKHELAPLFWKAKQDGYGITIHASENGNTGNIIQAIKNFGADRIGHANYMNSHISHDLVDTITKNNTHIEFIHTRPKVDLMPGFINIHKLIADNEFNRHGSDTIRDYFNASALNKGFGDNIPEIYNFSINSDDPGMFNRSLSEVINSTGCDNTEIYSLMHMANRASFAKDKTKFKIAGKINDFVKA